MSSLIDALLLDPYPLEVWIADRTDAMKGSGTLNDPWDGSTQAKFDAIMNGLPAGTPTRVHFGFMKIKCFACFCAVVVLLPFRATGAVVGVGIPNGGSTGNTFAQEPFSLESLGISSSRYQQVYSASEFFSAIPNGGFINEIVFRYDETVGSTARTFLPEVQIDFAVTPRGPDFQREHWQ